MPTKRTPPAAVITDPAVESIIADICRSLGYDPSRPPVNLSDDETSAVLGATVGTLCTWRSTGRYDISFVKVGRSVRYPTRGLAEFLARRTRAHTSAAV